MKRGRLGPPVRCAPEVVAGSAIFDRLLPAAAVARQNPRELAISAKTMLANRS